MHTSSSIQVHSGQIPKPPNHIRFVCLSDTHDMADCLLIPPGDVLLHAGDLTMVGLQDEVERFNDLLLSLPHQHKIIIAGNHDLTFDLKYQENLAKKFPHISGVDAATIKSSLKNCIYLEDSEVVIGGYKIYGSPWSPTFHNWAFNLDRGPDIAEKWTLIPKDTEILITHGPPYGILDMCYDGVNAGCEDLLGKVLEIKPLVHLFGHIHETYGVVHNEDTTFINGSNCTLRYDPANAPLVFDLPIKN